MDLRWRHQVTSLSPRPEGATVLVATAQGRYSIDADWVLACDGVRSLCRQLLGHDFAGQEFRDRFLTHSVIPVVTLPGL